jgi:hypothetical protein
MPNGESKLVIRKESIVEDPFPERDGKPIGGDSVTEDAIPKNDERNERAAFGSAKRRRVDAPAWFLNLARSRAEPEKVFTALIERLPDIKDTELVRLLVNEMGRFEAAEDVLKRNLTPEVAGRLHPKE